MPSLGQLPASNPAGNNQMSPATGGLGPTPGLTARPGTATPIPTTTSTVGNPNPLVAGLPAAVPASAGTTGLYDTASSYSNGQTNIDKQLVDIFGKGVGGSLDHILQGLSGTDSEIFQQWLAAQQAPDAQARAGLASTLGAAGVSGNSSVSAIASSNLEAQFAGQAAQENANLMTQNVQDSIGILTSMEGAASKEVATSAWSTFADVMQNITGDIGAMQGGPGPSPAANPAQAIPTMPNGTPQIGGYGQDATMASAFTPQDASALNQLPDLSMFTGG